VSADVFSFPRASNKVLTRRKHENEAIFEVRSRGSPTLQDIRQLERYFPNRSFSLLSLTPVAVSSLLISPYTATPALNVRPSSLPLPDLVMAQLLVLVGFRARCETVKKSVKEVKDGTPALRASSASLRPSDLRRLFWKSVWRKCCAEPLVRFLRAGVIFDVLLEFAAIANKRSRAEAERRWFITQLTLEDESLRQLKQKPQTARG